MDYSGPVRSTRFSKDVLRLFDPWSNFELVQKLPRMIMDEQVLVRMNTDAKRKSTDQYGSPRMMPDRIRG